MSALRPATARVRRRKGCFCLVIAVQIRVISLDIHAEENPTQLIKSFSTNSKLFVAPSRSLARGACHFISQTLRRRYSTHVTCSPTTAVTVTTSALKNAYDMMITADAAHDPLFFGLVNSMNPAETVARNTIHNDFCGGGAHALLPISDCMQLQLQNDQTTQRFSATSIPWWDQ